MELDEILALMAAPIYAQRMQRAFISSGVAEWPPNWAERRNEAMQVSVTEARMIWEIAGAEARGRRWER